MYFYLIARSQTIVEAGEKTWLNDPNRLPIISEGKEQREQLGFLVANALKKHEPVHLVAYGSNAAGIMLHEMLPTQDFTRYLVSEYFRELTKGEGECDVLWRLFTGLEEIVEREEGSACLVIISAELIRRMISEIYRQKAGAREVKIDPCSLTVLSLEKWLYQVHEVNTKADALPLG